MEFILPAVFSFLATSIFVIPTILFAKRFNMVDNPKLRPHPAHIQKRIVPRAGGLAIFLGIVLSILFFIELSSHILGLLLALALLLVVGLMDDKQQNLSPYVRLFIQFLASLVVVSTGVSIMFITNPLGGIINFNSSIFPYFGQLLTIFWFVWVMNMINWSKGVDGQMPGVTTVAALILGILSVKLYLGGDPNQLSVAKLAFISAASSFAFLIFNWYPAKIFPGFSGSNILGFMIATLAISSGAKLATAGLVLLIPATDFAYTFIRRLLQGKSPVWGDRGHLHHKLIDLGFTHQQISYVYILGSVILGGIALSLTSSGKLFAGLVVATIILGGILWLNFFGGLSKPPAPDNG